MAGEREDEGERDTVVVRGKRNVGQEEEQELARGRGYKSTGVPVGGSTRVQSGNTCNIKSRGTSFLARA